jgi:hypothetical protein
MKLILGMAFLLVFEVSNAQYVDIMPYYGYQFAATVDAYYYNSAARFRIKPAANYGLELDVVLPYNDISITASFTNSSTYVTSQENFQAEEKLFDATQQYWMFGVSREVDMEQLRPFIGLIMGWTTVNPADVSLQNLTKFTLGLRGGVKYFISDRIGIFARARLLLPVQWAGAGIWFGSGSGITLNTGTSIVTGDVGGGIIISLGDK